MIPNFLFFKSQRQHFYSKYKNGVLRIIANHFLISAVVALAIILTLPSIFDKYIIKITSREKIPPNTRYYYADCNDDGVSEKIEFRQLENDHFSLTVFEKNRTIDQWNFKGRYLRTPQAVAAKVSNDNTSSIYFFVFLNNKIYLNCLNPFTNKFSVRDKFVIDYTPLNQELDTELFALIFFDHNKDGIKEFYFATETAYSKQPRRVFKYDPVNDTILMSVKSYAAIVPNSTIIDTADNDLKFIFASHAHGNSKLTDPYSDMFAWLMCIDANLELKDKPMRIGFYSSMSKIISIVIDKKKYFVCLNIYQGIEKHLCSLRLFDSELQLVKGKKIPFTPELKEAVLCAPDESSNFFYIIKVNGQFQKYNTELNLLSNEIYFPFNGFYSNAEDVDGDNKGELIFRSKDGEQVIISERDFSSYSFANIAGLGDIRNFSLRLNGREPRELALFTDTEELILVYRSNELYYLQYPVYAGIYVVVLLFIFLIQKAQRHIAEQKYQAEKRIVELQLKAIKNQIDPHFTLNIINSIGSLFYKQEREKADYLFGKYNKFLRTTILNSDKIITTLQDELDHVENYLELEKFRSDGKLSWQFDLDKNVNMEIKIPKMLIHTFVENAIKHGLRNSEKNGMLLISVSASDNEHVILVRDNGIGRAGALKLSTFGTGKGMQILDQILELYYNLMKVRITYTINDLYNDEKESAGTEIVIVIPK